MLRSPDHGPTLYPKQEWSGFTFWLASGDYDAAMDDITAHIEQRRELDGPYWLVKSNAWNDPILEQPEWVELREKMGYPDLRAQ